MERIASGGGANSAPRSAPAEAGSGRQLQDRLGVGGREAAVGGGSPVEPLVAQVLARRRPDRDVARHAQAEDVLGVAGHASSIAMLPLRIDVVDVGELPVDEAVERHLGRADGDAGFLVDLAHAGLDQRFGERILRAGDALPEARRVGALEQQHVELVAVDDDEHRLRDLERLQLAGPCVFLRRMCSSRSCFSSTGPGALVSRSWARCVFGKAITSRSDSAPVISITKRSRPIAMPPCGGAPYCSASSRKPNFARASSASILRARKTLLCTSSRWIRTEPPPSSMPFRTTS